MCRSQACIYGNIWEYLRAHKQEKVGKGKVLFFVFLNYLHCRNLFIQLCLKEDSGFDAI